MNPFNIWNIGDDYLEEEDVIEYEDEEDEEEEENDFDLDEI